MTDWNVHFRRICMSHRMTRQDVVECCRLGGLEVSSSKTDGWKRAKASDHRSTSAMSEEDFEAFTFGLVEWARDEYRNTGQ